MENGTAGREKGTVRSETVDVLVYREDHFNVNASNAFVIIIKELILMKEAVLF